MEHRRPKAGDAPPSGVSWVWCCQVHIADRPHRQLRTDKGNGRRRRRNSNTRNSAGSMRVRGHVGHVCSAAPAPEPPCDLSRALSGSANTLNRDSRCSCSIREDASCCHPDLSSSWSRGGRKPAANALQLGGSKPCTPAKPRAAWAACHTLCPLGSPSNCAIIRAATSG